MSEKIILPGWVKRYHNQGYGFGELVDVAILMARYTNETSAYHYLDECLEISGKTKEEFLQLHLNSNLDKKRVLAEALAEDLLDSGKYDIMMKLVQDVFTPKNKSIDTGNESEDLFNSIEELEI